MSKKQDEARKQKEELSGLNMNSLPDDGNSKPAPEFRFESREDHQAVLAVYNVRGALVIPSEYLGLPVTEIDGDALLNCQNMTSITIPATVTSIGSGVFKGCDSLKSIKVAKDNPSYKSEKGVLLTKNGKTILGSARAAVRAYIPKGAETIGDYAFSENKNLKSVKIPEGVKEVGEGAFEGCASITRLSLPDSLKKIGKKAFRNCQKLKSVSLPDGIAYVGVAAFNFCAALKEVFRPEGLGRHLKHAFYFDSKQTRIIEKVNYKYIKVNGNNIGYRKNYKEKGWSVFWPYIGILKGALVIPKEIEGRPVTRIGSYAFEDCSKITSVELPDSIKEIEEQAFFDCDGLTSVRISKSVTNIENRAFLRCRRLKSIVVDPDNPVYSSVSGLLLSKDGKTLHTIPSGMKSVNIPEGVEKIDSGACSDGFVKSVIIPQSVKSIGAFAFSYCRKLRTVTIPESVQSIGDGAFYACNLASVIIPDGLKSIGEEAFKDCDLKKVVLPDSLGSIGKEAFEDCRKLKIVTVLKRAANAGKGRAIAAPNTANIIKEGIFSGYNSKLTKFIIPKSISVIGEEALELALNLTKIIVPNGVTIIGRNAFSYCRKLKSVSIPKSVTSIGEYRSKDKEHFSDEVSFYSEWRDKNIEPETKGAFDGCEVLKSTNVARSNPVYRSVSGLLLTKDGKKLVEVPKGKIQVKIPNGVKVIGHSAFAGCKKLVSVTIPDSVTRIGDCAFKDCSALTNITLPKSVTRIGKNAFWGCAGLKFLQVADENSSYKSESGLLLSKDGADLLFVTKELTKVTVPPGVTSIHDGAFEECHTTDVTLPDSLTSIGEAAFFKCNELDNISLPSRITHIGKSAFCSCEGISGIIIPGGVAEIGEKAFCGCSELKDVIIEHGVASIGKKAFCNCEKLSEVLIPDTVASIGPSAFFRCAELKKVSLPHGLVHIEKGTFAGCCGLVNFEIPESVTEIGSSAFEGCSSLASVTIPDSVAEIGSSAFKDCDSLATAKLPGGISTIKKSVFEYCLHLKKITIPDSVVTIKPDAFKRCENLMSVSLPKHFKNKPKLLRNAFYDCSISMEITYRD